MNEHLRAAAEARASGERYVARANRPTERRAGEDPNSFRGLVTSAAPQIREAGEGSEGVGFWGLACRTNTGYEMYDWAGPYVEKVTAGAFADSLNRADLDVPLVLQHIDLRRIARTTIPAGEVGHLALVETEDGLECIAPLLDLADSDVDYILRKIRSGLVTEMSFKFRIEAGTWSPDWTEYHIERVDIHRGDVAICGYGANPNTLAEARQLAKPTPIARAQWADFPGDLKPYRASA